MINAFCGVVVNLVGDGVSTTVDVDLDNIPTGSSSMPPTSEIVGFGNISVSGPSPTPTVVGEVKSGSKHIITLTFSVPLAEFVGNNAYSLTIFLILAPQ